MKATSSIFKIYSDTTRLRTLMLLNRAELCVCQIMGVLGVSQPLVSRNLSILNAAGLLNERREGKLVFYSMRDKIDAPHSTIVEIVKSLASGDKVFSLDLASLADCMEYQEKAGSCDMKTFLAYMKERKAKSASSNMPRQSPGKKIA